MLTYKLTEKTNKWSLDSSDNDILQKEVGILRKENADLRVKISAIKSKLKGKILNAKTHRDASLSLSTRGKCMCAMSVYSSAKTDFDAFDTAELNKICRKIVQKTVFTLTMDELRYMHRIVYTAALEKDPYRNMTHKLTMDMDSHEGRMEILKNELIENKKRLKRLAGHATTTTSYHC